jgi:hypothetical protein
MPAFDLPQPTSAADAHKLLQQHGEQAWVMAGGLDSPDWLKDRIKKPKVLVDLSGIDELKGIRTSSDGIARRRLRGRRTNGWKAPSPWLRPEPGGDSTENHVCYSSANTLARPDTTDNAPPWKNRFSPFRAPIADSRLKDPGS